MLGLGAALLLALEAAGEVFADHTPTAQRRGVFEEVAVALAAMVLVAACWTPRGGRVFGALVALTALLGVLGFLAWRR